MLKRVQHDGSEEISTTLPPRAWTSWMFDRVYSNKGPGSCDPGPLPPPRGEDQQVLRAGRFRRRIAAPTHPKPAIIIAQDAGSGAALVDPAGTVSVGAVVMGWYASLNDQFTMSCALQSAPVLAEKPT